MSFEVTTAFVKQFQSNLEHQSQQRGSRLMDKVRVVPVTGDEWFVEQLGATEMQKKKTRHGDSPILSTPHDRRMGTLEDFEWGDLLDNEDAVRMLIDPKSAYIQAASYAMGRTRDDVVLAALDATARVGKAGTTNKALPVSQKVAVDLEAAGTNTNLTIEKLIRARTLFDDNDVDVSDPENHLYLAVTASQKEALLRQSEVGSHDYNEIRALVHGEVNSFMGFEFVTFGKNRMLTDSNDCRRCIAWAKSGVAAGATGNDRTEVAKRPDKGFNWYAYAALTVGATRLEEEKVVQVLCDESRSLLPSS